MQLLRLDKVGIRHDDGFMLGVAGKGKGIENAVDTAKLINETKPSIIWFGTLGLFEGAPMHTDMLNGKFISASASIQGMLPYDKDKMISQLKNYIKHTDSRFLNSAKTRNTL